MDYDAAWDVLDTHGGGCDCSRFEEAARTLGYRPRVDAPIGVLTARSVNNGAGLYGREEVLAAEESGTEPLADLLDYRITVPTLERIEEGTAHDRYVIRYNPFADVDTTVQDYIRESDFFTAVNPVVTNTTLTYKDSFRDAFHDQDLPLVPGRDVAGVLTRGEEFLDRAFPWTDRYVVKYERGGGGNAVQAVAGEADVAAYVNWLYRDGRDILEHYADWEEDRYEALGPQIEPFVEHTADIRVMLMDGVVAAEKRYGAPDDFRCNLSLVEGGGLEKALRIHDEGLAEVMTVSHEHEEIEALPDAVHALGEAVLDHYTSTPTRPDVAGSKHVIAADIMVTDRETVRDWPDHVREPALEWADGDRVYLLNEVNAFGGDIIGQLHYWDGIPEEMPVLHEYRRMRDLAGTDPIDPETVVAEDGPVWERIDAFYPAIEEARARV